MRLLHVATLEFKDFPDRKAVPPYVIASHRWAGTEEVTFQDVRDSTRTNSAGYLKIAAFADYITRNFPAIEWLWIDTCCINKQDKDELQRSLISMFDWYRESEICLAWLQDVESSSLAESVWWTRGWTLQELLAPRTVIFLSRTWQVMGNKGVASSEHTYAAQAGANLEQEIATRSGIPLLVLHDFDQSRDLGIEERLSWMNGRTTTVEEDMTYALFGILDVFMPALYGERDSRAKRRFRAAIQQESDRTKMLLGWISAPDPYEDHEAARLQHEPGTGAWLLRHPIYLAWKLGISKNVLWMRGKPGCGKSVLCSTAIENIAEYCRALTAASQVIFYCSFRDESKRTYKGLISSLLEQIAWKSPGPSLLDEAYSRPGAKPMDLTEKEQTLLKCLASFGNVFLHIDGLDECRADGNDRLSVPQRLRELISKAPNLRVMVTSRDIPEIGHHMGELGAEVIVIEDNAVDLDIQQYVSNQIEVHWKLKRLDRTTKALIEETLANNAKGM
jgi:hypothetical protein